MKHDRAKLVWIFLPLLLAGCLRSALNPVSTPSGKFTPGPTPRASAIAQKYPRVDGSTSAFPLQQLIACKIMNAHCIWDDLFGERRLLVDVSSITQQTAETITNIEHTNTHTAYINLIDGNTDFILVARLPSQDEIQAARAKRVRLDASPIALDAFVFLAHKDNPVGSLTLDQIRDIYSGKIADWSQVGGTAGEIHAYLRNPNSGSQELMEALVMKGTPMIEAPDMMLESMIGPLNAIRDDIPGLGYSVFYYVTFMQPEENIKLLGIAGVVPSSETIAAREYPLVTEVYAVIRADAPPDHPAVMLRDWLLTEAGQQAVQESGYVALR